MIDEPSAFAFINKLPLPMIESEKMNANEIALEFEEYLKEIEELPWGNHQILCDQAATMLRTIPALQAEIEALKADNEQMCKALFKATRAILKEA